MSSALLQESIGSHLPPSNAGRVCTVGNKNYYSPNSTRDLGFIPAQPTDCDNPKNIFLPEVQYKPPQKNRPRVSYYDFSRIFVEDYQFPRWWTDRWGWTAFVLKMADFKGANGIFYPLGERIVLQRKQRKWQLSEAVLARLSELETEIITAIHFLAALTQANVIYPPPPRVFGYQKWYDSAENATKCVERSRRWFLVWLGLFSYLVAVAETKEESLRAYEYLRIPEWTRHLQDNGFHQTWIDNVLSSAICSFDRSTPRAGILIKLKPGPSNQPSLDWYCQYSIPVWYELTKDSPPIPDKFASRTCELRPANFQTNTYHIPDCDDDSLLYQACSPPENSDEPCALSDRAASTGEPASSQMLFDADAEWRAFFAARDSQNTSLIANENPAQRQKRLAREKIPATTSAKIFEWLPDNNGVYKRQAVLGKYKQDTFEGYTKNQTRYDALRNEWDFCVAFAPTEEVSDDEYASDSDISTPPRNTSVNTPSRDEPVSKHDNSTSSDFDMYAAPDTAGNNTVITETISEDPIEIGVDVVGSVPDHVMYDKSGDPTEGYDGSGDLAEEDDKSGDLAEEDDKSGDFSDMPHTTEDEISCEPLFQKARTLPTIQHTVLPHDDATDWIPETLSSIVANSSSTITSQDLMEAEILQRAYRKYGFSPQGCPQNVPPLRDDKKKRDLMQVLGFRWYAEKADVLERQHIAHLSHFLDCLSRNQPVSSLDWDLGESHTNRVPLLPRYSTIQIVTVGADSTKLYMFRRDKSSSVEWNLAMTTAEHALLVCRLDADWDMVHITRYLLGNGIPFRTLQPSTSIHRAPLMSAKSQFRAPLRPSGYVFTAEDYKSYRDRCEEILQTPRGRVALMMGGHIWRIAVTLVSFDDVLRGPSGWYTDSEKMLVTTDPLTGEEFIDDQFTEGEIESLCGLNIYLTGNREQQAKLTWYPLPKTFQHSGQDYGCWTEVLDAPFLVTSMTRDEAVGRLNGGQNIVLERQPVAVRKWRDLVRGSGGLRRLNLAYNKKAAEFLVKNCP